MAAPKGLQAPYKQLPPTSHPHCSSPGGGTRQVHSRESETDPKAGPTSGVTLCATTTLRSGWPTSPQELEAEIQQF